MPKRKNTHYSCTACGAEALRWEGRCPRCEAWDSLVEIDAQDAPERFPVILGQRSSTLVTVDAVSNLESSRRITFGLPETMRVLGGGLVPGSAVLLAGEPGIGKSTLLLQMAAAIAATGASVLYVAGEESPGQIGARAQRLGLGAVSGLSLLAETNVASLLAQAEAFRPHVVLVDSVQSLTLDALGSAPGSLAQVRECASRLVDWAKRSHIPVIMTGHVTKDGAIAGPKVLEHTVDAVLSLEGDSLGPFRVLRATKNRFGSTNEVAVFEMAETGLTEVNDPSSVLLAERPKDASGTAVVPIIEGSRPLLVEVQALVSPAAGPEPRRAANGVDASRLLMISAVLSRRADVPLGRQDIIVSAVGGLRVSDPGADLALALAIVSSARDIPLGATTAAIGEIGLTGEVRRVSQGDRRISEAARLGFTRIIAPATLAGTGVRYPAGVEIISVATVREAVLAATSTPGRSTPRRMEVR